MANERKRRRSVLQRTLGLLSRNLAGVISPAFGGTAKPMPLVNPAIVKVLERSELTLLETENRILPILTDLIGSLQSIGDAATDIVAELPGPFRTKAVDQVQELLDLPAYTLLEFVKRTLDIALSSNQETIRGIKLDIARRKK